MAHKMLLNVSSTILTSEKTVICCHTNTGTAWKSPIMFGPVVQNQHPRGTTLQLGGEGGLTSLFLFCHGQCHARRPASARVLKRKRELLLKTCPATLRLGCRFHWWSNKRCSRKNSVYAEDNWSLAVCRSPRVTFMDWVMLCPKYIASVFLCD